LWCDAIGEKDYFVHAKNDAINRLIVTCDIQKLIIYADENNLKLASRSEIDLELNLDKSNSMLSKLKHGKKISEKKAALLLNLWNTFDDISNTIGRSLMPSRTYECSGNEIYRISEKLLYGNNLPAITPEGKKYHPIFSKKEIYFIKHAFSFALKEIINMITQQLIVETT
jgi:hypothetical protein